MYILGSAGPTFEVWSFRPVVELLSRVVVWLTTFLSTTTRLFCQDFPTSVSIQDASVSMPYLLGLGKVLKCRVNAHC